MAKKVLKVKLWADDEERSWKRNVQEINGEVLCGKLPQCFYELTLILASIAIHSSRFYKEEQSRLPQSCVACASQGALRQVHGHATVSVPARPYQGRRVSGHYGCCSCQ